MEKRNNGDTNNYTHFHFWALKDFAVFGIAINTSISYIFIY